MVHEYRPAPGQFVNSAAFGDPSRALGAPVGGGTVSPDNSKLVSLGGFGGSITLGFPRRVVRDARHPGGLDFIVFGNASWVNGDPTRRFTEAAVIEISRDDNGNGIPDDQWYVIRGSHLPVVPVDAQRTVVWDRNDFAYPASWFPESAPDVYETTGFEAPAVFADVALEHPLGAAAVDEVHWGYADMTPTLRLGDMSGASGGAGDNSLGDAEDRPGIAPEHFYTRPTDPRLVGIAPGSGGGDAFAIAWAVHPETGAPADLDGFDFIRITTAVDAVRGPLGEVSAEIGGVAMVRVPGDLNGDGVVDGTDLGLLLLAWGSGDAAADLSGDGVVDGTDLGILLLHWG